MFGRSEFLRRVGRGLDAVLVPGEERRAAAFLRGPGPVGGPLAEPGRDSDWVLVVTDRRVLLFPVAAGTGPAEARSAAVRSFPLDGVHLVDATLRGPAPVLVLRFPDALLGWFHPLSAWRVETEELIAELRRGRPDDAYPEENRPARERRVR